MAEQPFSVTGDVERCVREAVEALTTPSKRDRGRFTAGNTDAATTLDRSEQFWEAVEPAKQEVIQRCVSALAITDADPPTKLALVDAFAEIHLLRKAQFRRVVGMGGPFTSTDRPRPMFDRYLATVDRELKLAKELGLERRERDLNVAQRFAAMHDGVQS